MRPNIRCICAITMAITFTGGSLLGLSPLFSPACALAQGELESYDEAPGDYESEKEEAPQSEIAQESEATEQELLTVEIFPEEESLQTVEILPRETPSPEELEASLSPPKRPKAAKKEKALALAGELSLQYDYEGAIEALTSVKHYQNDEEMTEAIALYQQTLSSCQEYPLEQITHVFFHTLIYDTSLAFDGEYTSAGYNQVMTTVSEFKKILKQMYAKGYVLVSPHDMAYKDENGVMQRGRILLPPGKIPFVLSQDDVSYYHYMDGDGMATRLVVDQEGAVKCAYKNPDGSESIGNYDLVPILDAFVKKHPDFSYRGRKGILAMTGYNGVLGYRTDSAYKTLENLDATQQAFMEANPNFDYEAQVKQATRVATVMKENGWEFASHTWGHRNATTSTAEELAWDDARYKETVVPVLGQTDMIIFAFGADIGNWEPYTWDNPKFAYYKNAGYDYYCNVDSSQYWVQITGDYFRQGRRNLDGYRMYYNPDMLSDLFDVSSVWDEARPTPVDPM